MTAENFGLSVSPTCRVLGKNSSIFSCVGLACIRDCAIIIRKGGSKTRGGAQPNLTSLGRGVTCKFLGKWVGGGVGNLKTDFKIQMPKIFH